MDRSFPTIRIAAAQTPEFRGAVDDAIGWLGASANAAEAEGAVLLCLPEGFLQGYLTDAEEAGRHAMSLSSPAFEAVLERLPKTGPTLVFGMIEAEGEVLFNTAVVVKGGVLIGRYRKTHLLGGERGFAAGDDCPVFSVGGLRFGINICFDTTAPAAARAVADQGASLLVVPANNMMGRDAAGVWKDRHNAIRGDRCRETGLWMISADVTGERGDRVGWGPTAVVDPNGEVVAQLPLGRPGLLVFDLPI